jgi:hypothetical protein
MFLLLPTNALLNRLHHEEMVTAHLGSQCSKDGGAKGSSLVATTILHTIVQDLAFAAWNRAQNRILKQAARNQSLHPPWHQLMASY